jgi:DNA-directed RNA polymerase specialized sigma24 family protein
LPREDNADAVSTLAVEHLPETGAVDMAAVFETEWRRQLLAVAFERLKPRFTLRQIQIFDLNVFQEWPAKRVAQALGVSLAKVYVTKHRISSALAEELKRLQRAGEATDVRDEEGTA